MSLWAAISLFLTLFYVVQFLKAWFHWKRISVHTTTDKKPNTNFSLVIAARNEEENIQQLLETLRNLEYPSNQFEIIIVDDFSTDNTLAKLENAVSVFPNLKVLSLENLGLAHKKAFKKKAIQVGIHHASHKWIITTDADCQLDPKHLQALAFFINKHDPKFISGPVLYKPASIFGAMQTVEFMGLVTLGAAYLQREIPFLCNGANMAFPKAVFEDLNGFKGVDDDESGDDVWFMHKVYKRYPLEMFFMKHSNAIVRTKPSPGLSSFLNQRKRWTSKNSSYGKTNQTLILAADYLFYIAIVANLIAGIWRVSLHELLAVMLAGKFVVESLFFYQANRFFKIRRWFGWYLVAFIPQIFYVILIYPLSQLTRFEWKNRSFDV